MAVFYREGETKKRPGVYQRHENIGLDTLVEARDGICAIPIKASWGPLGVVVTNTNKTMLKKNYGDGEYSADFTVPAAKELFNGGAVIVYTYRLGTGGTAASAEVTTGLTITAKYPGTAELSVAIQTKLADPKKKEVLVYFGTTLVESIDFKADATAEGQNLVDAVNEDSDYITAAETPEGTLPTVVPAVAYRADVSPRDYYCPCFWSQPKCYYHSCRHLQPSPYPSAACGEPILPPGDQVCQAVRYTPLRLFHVLRSMQRSALRSFSNLRSHNLQPYRR